MLKRKISYLLQMYDSIIQRDLKVKLAQLIMSQTPASNYQQMLQHFTQIVNYCITLVKKKVLPRPVISEIRILFSKLGVKGFCTGFQCSMGIGNFGTQKFPVSLTEGVIGVARLSTGISINYHQLISMLYLSSIATFTVTTKTDCVAARLCDGRMLETVCPYGVSECRATVKNFRSRLTCRVQLTECNKYPSIPQLSSVDMLNLLKIHGAAETITFSHEACQAIGNQYLASTKSRFGGISIQVSYNKATKRCSLTVKGEDGVRDPTAVLPFLDMQQVGMRAALRVEAASQRQFGVKFKTPDQHTCYQYCNSDVDIPSSCPGNFECHRSAKCWPGACICEITHKCAINMFSKGNRMGLFASAPQDKNVYKQENVTIEETMEIPKVQPTVNTGNTLIRRKETDEKEKKKTVGSGSAKKEETNGTANANKDNTDKKEKKKTDVVGKANRQEMEEDKPIDADNKLESEQEKVEAKGGVKDKASEPVIKENTNKTLTDGKAASIPGKINGSKTITNEEVKSAR